MKARWIFVAPIAAALIAGAAWSLGQLASARATYERQLAATKAAESDVARLMALREQGVALQASERPAQDLIARVQETLLAAGMPHSRLRELVPQSDARAGSGAQANLRRQTVSLTLEALAPAEVGRFLSAWEQSHASWTPVSIALTHRRGGGTETGYYDLELSLAALYLADHGPSNTAD